MATTIKLKRSAVPGNVPTTAQLQLGEIAINTYDGKLYIKKDTGTESIVLIGPAAPAVADPGSNGIVVRTSSTTSTTRTITGTTNQITVSNGDGTGGNPTISLSSDPVLPGTGAVTVPSGTTAQRPVSPLPGMIRYNSTTGRIEAYESSWGEIFGSSSQPLNQIVYGTGTGVSSSSFLQFDSSLKTLTLQDRAVINGGSASPANWTLLSSDRIRVGGTTGNTNESVSVVGAARGVLLLGGHLNTTSTSHNAIKFLSTQRSTTDENTAAVAYIGNTLTNGTSTTGGGLIFSTRPTSGSLTQRVFISDAGNVTIYTPSAGGHTLTLSGTNPLLLDNQSAIQFKDSGGTNRTVVTMTSANNVQLQNGGATTGNIQIINTNASGVVGLYTNNGANYFQIDSAGNMFNTTTATAQQSFSLFGGNNSYYRMTNNSAAANEKNWLWLVTPTSYSLRAYNDLLDSSTLGINFVRSGNTITQTELFAGGSARVVVYNTGRVSFGGTNSPGADIISLENSTARSVSNPYFYIASPSSGILQLYGYDGTSTGVGTFRINSNVNINNVGGANFINGGTWFDNNNSDAIIIRSGGTFGVGNPYFAFKKVSNTTLQIIGGWNGSALEGNIDVYTGSGFSVKAPVSGAALSVEGSSASDTVAQFQGNTVNGVVQIKGSGTGTGYLMLGNATNGERVRLLGDNNRTFAISCNGGSSYAMTINSNHNVTIGTPTSGTALTVNAISGGVATRWTQGTVNLETQVTGTTAYFGTSTNHPVVFITNNTERGFFSSGGSFTIGTSTISSDAFEIVRGLNTATVMRFYQSGIQEWWYGMPATSGVLTWGTGSGYATTRLTLDTAGNLTAAGNVTAYSDKRIKTNIKPIENALEKVTSLTGVSFKRTDTNENGIGLIAQDVQQVFPEAVHEANDEQKTLSIAYGNLIGPLVEAIKELKAENDLLKQRINALEEKANVI